MQEYALGVGDELVIEGGIRLTLLAVEAGEVVLGIAAPEPSDVAGLPAATGCRQAARQPAPESNLGGGEGASPP